jgi:CBS domain containing-hemolysin-like protein
MKRMSWRGTTRFALVVAALSFLLGGVFDTSTVFLNATKWYIGAAIVLIIVIVGVIFDMLGLAAAAARETPFHAMASKRIFGAKNAIMIVRNAEKVSSLCSDVVGDIAGVLSGAGALAVSTQLYHAMNLHGWYRELTVIGVTALITAVTVGLKAIGKTVAIHTPTPIVLFAARVLETIAWSRRAR